MHWGNNGLRWRCFAVLLTIMCCFGCSGISQEKTDPIITVEQMNNAKTFSSKDEPASVLLDNSIELPNLNIENHYFIPRNVFNDKLYGIVNLKNSTTDVALSYLDLDTKEYVTIKKAQGTSTFASMDVLLANEEFVVFWENHQEGNYGELDIYMYSFATRETTLITHVPVYPVMFRLSAVQMDQSIYFSLPYEIENTWESASALYEYNLVDQKMSFIRENAYLLKRRDQSIFFQTNGEEKKTVTSYNVDTKVETELFRIDSSKEDILDYSLNEEELFFLLSKEEENDQSSEVSYRYNFKTKTLTKFIENQYMGAISTSHGLFTWTSRSADDVPVGTRNPYFLYDLKNNINYIYKDSVVLICEEGILWVKYNVENNTIPKGEVFLNNNTTLFFQYFEQ